MLNMWEGEKVYLKDLIAHKNLDGKVQPLTEHLIQVAILAGSYLEKINLKYCGIVAGVLHDIGKASIECQEHIVNSSSQMGCGPDHSTAGAIYLLNNIKKSTDSHQLLTMQILGACIMGHHSGLLDFVSPNGDTPFYDRLDITGTDYEKIYKLVSQKSSEWLYEFGIDEYFGLAVQEIKEMLSRIKQEKLNIPFAISMTTNIIFSALIDADHFDTARFMDPNINLENHDTTRLWLSLDNVLTKNVTNLKVDSELANIRMQISKECLKNAEKDTGIYILDSPTGSGKTLSSLRFAIRHAIDKSKSRIFYIAPYIQIVDQNASAIRKALDLRKDSETLLEIHSEKDKTNNILSLQMDAPLIATTMVRFLNTIFSQGTSNRRGFHNMANSIIIFDEIQNLDVKFTAIFNETCNFLAKICNTTIVMTTATQPSTNRKEISELKIGNDVLLAEITMDMQSSLKRVNIENKCKIGGYTKDEVKNFILKTFHSKRNMAVIVNTKLAVEKIYNALKTEVDTETELITLSRNLCPEHRRNIIKKLRYYIQKNRKFIVISTQLLDAGIDISFNTVIRSLAGLDSIIQSAGRCNRNFEYGLEYTYIINPEFDDVSKIDVIFNKKRATERLLLADPEEYGNDLSSAKAMQLFFQQYTRESGTTYMKYPITDRGIDTTIFDCLSGNRKGISNFKCMKHQTVIVPIMTQAFHTATEAFKAIDVEEKQLIVGYGDGISLCNKLKKTTKLSEKIQLLKKLQPFTLQITDHIYNKIFDKGYYDEDLKVLLLDNNYYNKFTGLVTN